MEYTVLDRSWGLRLPSRQTASRYRRLRPSHLLALQRPAALQASSLADRLCAFARSQVGHGYVWGGKGEDLTRMSDPEAGSAARSFLLNALRAIVFFLEAQSNRRGPVRAYDASG